MSGATAEDAHDALLEIAQLTDLEPIRRSAAGVVYAATDRKLERRVAVRLLNRLTDDRDRLRFDRESRLLGRLSAHPNVVTIYDAGFTAGERPFLITELVEGEDLAAYLAHRRALPWEAAADVALQICAGLEQAHRSGALHRRLRPENILMVGMTPKLSDFGITALDPTADVDRVEVDGVESAGPAHGRNSDRAEPRTEADLWLHRAPEALGGQWDERSDLYSVASILYELIDGHAPFWRPGHDSLDALWLRLRHEAPPPIDPELVPAVLNVFISAALSKDPIDRPQTADEFSHELRLIREGRTTGSNPSVLHGSGPVPIVSPTSLSTLATVSSPAVPVPPLGPTGRSQLDRYPAPAVPSSFGTRPELYEPSADLRPSPSGPSAFVGAGDHGGDGHTTVYGAFEVPGTVAGTPDGFAADAGWQPDGYHPDQPTDGGDIDRFGFIDSGPGAGPAVEAATADGSLNGSESPPAGRSTGFVAAVAMIAVGLVGLLAVAALSALRSDDNPQAAPVLPDPNQPPSIVAAADGSSPTAVGPDAMVDETSDTTATTAEQMSTTETTIPRYAVPDLTNLDVEIATRRLADAGFDVLIVGRKSLNAAPGKVLQQTPQPGGLVTLPLTVTLYIPKVANLPSMVGRTADAVCLELRALTLTCNRVVQNNDQVPAGSVISTNPVEGATFAEGSSVEVIVSRGPVTTVAVPEVAGLTRAEAQATLMAAGFTVIVYGSQPSATVELDRAVGSNPAAATPLATDQPVTVLLSSGPPTKVTVPQLVGMTGDNAQTALAAAGLTATVAPQDLPAGDGGIGMVLAMNPGAGSSVDAGSAVMITVGRQQAESSTTTTTTTSTTAAASGG